MDLLTEPAKPKFCWAVYWCVTCLIGGAGCSSQKRDAVKPVVTQDSSKTKQPKASPGALAQDASSGNQAKTIPSGNAEEDAKFEQVAQKSDEVEHSNPSRTKTKNPKKRTLRHPFPGARPAPSLEGEFDWINTAGPLDLKDLRGKFVLLDFWTYCCINCIHILPELKKLEKAYPNELVVIGVHSAKFLTEEDTKNITEAVLRYEIEHPVVNDSQHKIWDRYFVRSWPSLRLIDPEGNLVIAISGEFQFEDFDRFFKATLPYYRKNGLLDTRPLRFDLAVYRAKKTPLRFPGKLLADPAGDRLFIADSNHNRIVVTSLKGTLIETIGSGAIGTRDGNFRTATFNHPQGMAIKENVLYVADTENHMLRKIDLKKKTVKTISGTGSQRRSSWPRSKRSEPGAIGRGPIRWVGKPSEEALNSPWALWIHGADLYIAMAGPHQIWKMTLDEREMGPFAGNGRESIVDGPHLPPWPYQQGFSSFAQPSGLASDGKFLFVADSEGSAIRAVPFDTSKKVTTVVGKSVHPSKRLFDFGDIDGKGAQVRLQHALGVVHHKGKLYVADTYNNKIKVIDPKEKTSKTIAGTKKPGRSDDPAAFDEPAGITVAGDVLYIADTNNHLVRTLNLKNNKVSTLQIKDLKPPQRPKPKLNPSKAFSGAQQVEVAPLSTRAVDGKIQLSVDIKLPSGYKINTLAPMHYLVEATAKEGPIDRKALSKLISVADPATRFDVVLPVKKPAGRETLRVSLNYFYCQEGKEGLCKVGSVTWTVPIEISPDAKTRADARAPLFLEVNN